MKIAFADETEDVAVVTVLINSVCTGAERVEAADIAAMIRSRELVVARDAGGGVVGVIRVERLSSERAEAGTLVIDPARRGAGIGRALVAFAEEWARAQGLARMQVKLRVPRAGGTRPAKDFLRRWFTSIGYREVRTVRLEEAYPQLLPLLPLIATACEFVIYRKDLQPA